MTRKREKVVSVNDLKELIMEGKNEYAKAIRILFHDYMRKHSLRYAINSKVRKVTKNLLYRCQIFEALENPKKFKSIRLVEEEKGSDE